MRRCSRCGTTKQHASHTCPAKQSTCNNCKKIGHWAAICRKKNIHAVNKEDSDAVDKKEDDAEDLYLGGVRATQNYIHSSNTRQRVDRIKVKETHSEPPWMAEVKIFGKHMTIKIDTGADVTVISERLYRQYCLNVALERTSRGLRVGDHIPLKVLGKIQAKITRQSLNIYM